MLKGQAAAMRYTSRDMTSGVAFRMISGATLTVTLAVILGVSIGGVAMPGPALAQESSNLTVDVADCVKLERPEERLACFERQVAEAEQARRPAGRAESPAELPIAAERRREPRASQEFAATIVDLRESIPDNYLITLENGQVRRQMRPKRYPLQPGYEVRIYSSRWGNSYRLSSPILNGFVQVERVR